MWPLYAAPHRKLSKLGAGWTFIMTEPSRMWHCLRNWGLKESIYIYLYIYINSILCRIFIGLLCQIKSCSKLATSSTLYHVIIIHSLVLMTRG